MNRNRNIAKKYFAWKEAEKERLRKEKEASKKNEK